MHFARISQIFECIKCVYLNVQSVHFRYSIARANIDENICIYLCAYVYMQIHMHIWMRRVCIHFKCIFERVYECIFECRVDEDSVHMCDMIVWRDCVTCPSSVTVWCDCVTWLLSCKYVLQDSCMYVIWLIRLCDMTHAYVRRDSFICVAWLIHMCNMTHLFWLHRRRRRW